MNKRILPIVLLIVFISVWHPCSTGGNNRETEVFPLSKNPRGNTAILLQDKNLILSDLPEDVRFVMLKLAGVDNTLPIKKINAVGKKTDSVTFNLRDVCDGTYFTQIYFATEDVTAYFSYVQGESLRIQINRSSIDFIDPQPLSHNEAVFAAEPQDRAVLMDFEKPSAKIQSDHPAIIELSQTITAEAFSDYEKAEAIHDWVCNNIWYDYDALHSGISEDKSALETLESQKGVCIDYASLTAALLRAAHIPAKLQAGYVLNTGESWSDELISGEKSNHAWNEAYIDGRWVIIDTSYDSNNTYKEKTFSAGTGLKNRKYFDITIEFLSVDRYIVLDEYNPVKFR